MKALDRLVDAIDSTTRVLAALACAAIVLVMSAQVYYRYVLNDSLQWSEEVAVWLMVWMVFLAAPILSRLGEHVTVTALVSHLPHRLQALLVMFAKLASLAFLLFLAWYGFIVFGQTFHKVSTSTGLSTRWVKLALPVGGVLMTIMSLASLARDVIAYRRGDRDHFDRQVMPSEPVGEA